MSRLGAARELARPTAYGIAVRAAGLFLGLLASIFLARMLAAEDLGVYQGVLSSSIIIGGLAAALAERPAARRIAAIEDRESDELPTEIASAHVLVGLALSALVFALVTASFLPGVPHATRVTLRVLALVAPAMAIQSLRQWIALPLRGVAASLGPEQIAQPIVFVGLVGIVASRTTLGPFETLLIYSFACWLVWLVGSWRSGLLAQLREGARAIPRGLGLRPRLREGRPFLLLSAVGVLPIYATVPMVAALLGAGDAGRLAIALQLTGLIGIPLQISSLAIMPQSATLHRDNATEALGALVRSASTISFALGLGLAGLLLVSAGTILSLLGPSFAATSELIPLLVLGQLVNATLGPNGPTLQMVGLERTAARIEAATTVVRLAAVAVAAATGNILGVALAITVTTMLRNLLLSTTLYRQVGIITLPQFPHRRDRH